ncbi:DUF3794 and LysM peptidoglycan-binding domain-containing protein [Haloimpatiens lingqiaonensis]|uniref:DUF3794 and LysM peptidoglycan-binding domain-containing protein n=1 Tax=Haloimpatiens lingqiaonensis TaxID=1380675 RepID=UPI0010FDC671|nr:SPOCS domain-containing protein [Haloimpatiens lingqiaonensis]
MELIRENIEYEQLLGENAVDTVLRQEFIIPDTHPDVEEILMVEANPLVISKEIMQNKIYIEGQIEYNVMYLAKGERGNEAFNVRYVGNFSNALELQGAERDMACDVESYVEHMECSIANERKIAIEGIIQLKAAVYKNYSFNIVKDVSGDEKVQLLKNPASIDKIVSFIPCEIIGKSRMQIPMEDPEISDIIKCDVNIHKEEVKLYDGKIKVEAMARIEVLYKSKDSREINYIEDDIFLSKEEENESIRIDMQDYTDYKVDAMNVEVKEDDLGEKRVINVEILVKTDTKLMYKEEIDMIEDAYSPELILGIERKNYLLNVVHGQTWCGTVVKGDITVEEEVPKPNKIIMSSGDVCITEKKLVEDKVIVEGVVDAKVLYKSDEENKYIYSMQDSIPFTCTAEVPGTKIDMNCIAKAKLESIEANVEPGNIAIKALVNVYVRVNYVTNKDFIVDMQVEEEGLPQKKASITIYVVQNGDTLWKIAKNYNCRMEDLATINSIDDVNMIKVGDKLIIPGRAVI